MDVLARLRSDMDDAGREAGTYGGNETTACLDILDEFIAGRGVVEALLCEGSGGEQRWLRLRDRSGPLYNPLKQPTQVIIVPRERKPSVLEVMETAHRYLSYLCLAAGDPGVTAEGARDALAEAIEKEKSNA